MAQYLLIESRDPFETLEVSNDYDLAVGLAKAGHQVTLFLVQNGVLPSRKSANHGGLRQVVDSNVEVLSDDFSLRERGIDQAALANGVKAAPIDIVVDQLAAGHKTIWL